MSGLSATFNFSATSTPGPTLTIVPSGGIFPYTFSAWTTPFGTVNGFTDPVIATVPTFTVVPTGIVFVPGLYTITVTDSTTPTPLTATFSYLLVAPTLTISFTDSNGNFYPNGATIPFSKGLKLTAHVSDATILTSQQLMNNPNGYLPTNLYKIGWYKYILLKGNENTFHVREPGLYSAVIWKNGVRGVAEVLVTLENETPI
jgi:hypothetical protein